jgi:predicted ATPase
VVSIGEQLVGRAETCGVFDDVLAELDRGRSAALALVGEPGIGKTRLLTELAARADARGHLVLGGSASELERDLPFWVFVDALDEYVQGLPSRRLEAIDDDLRSELAHVFPSLARFEAALVAKAHEASDVRRIVAHTPLGRPQTGRVLEKAGFVLVREMDDADEAGNVLSVKEWELAV